VAAGFAGSSLQSINYSPEMLQKTQGSPGLVETDDNDKREESPQRTHRQVQVQVVDPNIGLPLSAAEIHPDKR
jgi:hypothetical protein